MTLAGTTTIAASDVVRAFQLLPPQRNAMRGPQLVMGGAPIMMATLLSAFAMALLAAALFAALVFVTRYKVIKSARATFETWGGDEIEHHIDHQGVFTRTGNSHGEVQWSGITGYQQIGDYVFLKAFADPAAALTAIAGHCKPESATTKLLWLAGCYVLLILVFFALWSFLGSSGEPS